MRPRHNFPFDRVIDLPDIECSIEIELYPDERYPHHATYYTPEAERSVMPPGVGNPIVAIPRQASRFRNVIRRIQLFVMGIF